MTASFDLVKKRWWLVFGYDLLAFLVFFGIALVVIIPVEIIEFLMTLPYADYVVISSSSTPIYPIEIQVPLELVKAISNSLMQLVLVPLGIFFGKNFYSSLKKSK
jgi:hypothetical protein